MNKKMWATLLALGLIVSVPLSVEAMTGIDTRDQLEKEGKWSSDFTEPRPIEQEKIPAEPVKFDLNKTPEVKVLPKGISNMTEPRPITESDRHVPTQAQSNPTTVQSIISPEFITSPNWKYYDLPGSTYVETKESYTLSGTQDVPIKLVQYPSKSESANASISVGYKLVYLSGIVATPEIIINGSYTSQSTSFSFPQVPAGTYKLRIINRSSVNVDGNGYVFYW
ncbi:MAG: hypothetical protein ACK4UN_17460 [Limisphaerales bacterium]